MTSTVGQAVLATLHHDPAAGKRLSSPIGALGTKVAAAIVYVPARTGDHVRTSLLVVVSAAVVGLTGGCGLTYDQDTTAKPSTTTPPGRPVSSLATPTALTSTTPPTGGQLETLEGNHAPAAAALADARARWARSKPVNGYTWSYDNLCLCYPRSLEVDVDATGQAIASRSTDTTRVPLTRSILTVDDAFVDLQKAVDADVDRITVQFDPATGYPIRYSIDPDRQVVDDEHGFALRGFAARR
jgi:hypothetical protein